MSDDLCALEAEITRALLAHQARGVVATVNGHPIRPVTTRLGRVFAVGKTDRVFVTFDDAVAFAKTLT